MRRVYPVSLCFFPALVHFFTKDLVVPSASNRLGSESSTHAYLKKGCLAAAHIFCGNKAPEVWIPGCGAFWVPDQNAPTRGFLAQARSAAKAATAARRTPQEGLRATEVWIPDQTSGAQAPFFGGLLGPAARRALRATLGQDAPHGRGVKGSIRLAPDQTDRRRAPSSGLLG
ncbi:hypothetical protein C814_03244 [Anaerotruncus sp. G3(2012)]|nr:hypothetical protein C814_03244 [Anaerotruncus sp. G3(2012)]